MVTRRRGEAGADGESSTTASRRRTALRAARASAADTSCSTRGVDDTEVVGDEMTGGATAGCGGNTVGRLRSTDGDMATVEADEGGGTGVGSGRGSSGGDGVSNTTA